MCGYKGHVYDDGTYYCSRYIMHITSCKECDRNREVAMVCKDCKHYRNEHYLQWCYAYEITIDWHEGRPCVCYVPREVHDDSKL